MLSPEQSRAARGWLDWSQDDLAKKANVSLSTVRDFEKGRRTPIANNLDAIERALAEGGIRLVATANGKATGIAYEGKPQRGPTKQNKLGYKRAPDPQCRDRAQRLWRLTKYLLSWDRCLSKPR